MFILYVSVLIAAVSSQSDINDTGLSNFSGGLWNNSTVYSVRLPKCCPYGFAVGPGNCTESPFEFAPKFDVHDHNDTAFDDVPIKPDLIRFETYVLNPCRNKKFPIGSDEGPIILRNGSILIAGLGEYDGILNHEQFCVDNLFDGEDSSDSTVYAFLCIKEQVDEEYPLWVFPTFMIVMTISALLFICSVCFFYQQELHDLHKKCFMVYALFMGGAFFIIILAQFIQTDCKTLGLILEFFIISSFAWLAIMCFDLAWKIKFYRKKDDLDRFVAYTANATLYSTVFLIVSLTNHYTPDIPVNFFKPQFERSTCRRLDDDQRPSVFFTAVGLSLLVSLVSLGYCLLKMNKNRYRNSTDGLHQWNKVSKKFRYMYGRLLIVFVTMIAFLLDTFNDRFSRTSGISIILLLIQMLQGVIVVPLYTLKTVRKLIDINKKPKIENLQELMEIGKHCKDVELS